MPGIEDFFLDGDPNKPGPGPKPKPASGGIEDFFSDKPSSGGMAMGKSTQVNIDEYRKFMPEGVNSDFNIDLQRAQNQGKLETLGKTLGNIIPNVLTGMGEMVGFAGALVSEFGDDRDYSNALTKKMQEWKNPFGETYRENPNAVFDMGDSAWWAQNLGQLAESAATFALPGAAIGKGFQFAAKAASEALQLGKVGSAIASGAGQLASAAIMGYQEGAMSGFRVYDEAYKRQFQKNIDAGDDPVVADEKAKHVAAEAASTTVKMYTGLGAILNLTAFTPLFKKVDDEAYGWLSTQGKRQAGESIQGWRQRIAAAGFDNKDVARIFAPRGGISGIGSEIAQEGGEEVIQGYFDKVGEDIGAGRKVKEGLDVIGDFFDKAFDEEGLLSFALGGLGGGAQTAIIDNVPLHRVQKFDAAGKPIFKTNGTDLVLDAQGNPKYETQIVSSRTRNMDNSKRNFESIKDAIIADIDWFSKKNDEMMSTKDPVMKESIRADMFNVNNLNAITSGLGANWKQQYQEIADLDNTKSLSDAMQPMINDVTSQIKQAYDAGDTVTADQLNIQRQDLLTQQAKLSGVTEAMQKGYAKDKNDHWYKEQAQGAIQDLNALQSMWDATQKKYGQTDEQKASGLADFIFANQSDLYSHNKVLRHAEGEYARMEGEYEVQHAGLTEDFDVAARTYHSEWSQLEQERKAYEDDLKSIDTPGVQDKYHGLSPKEIKDKLTAEINRLNKKGHELNENLRATFDASPWVVKNPGKKYDDYFKALQAKFTDRNELNAYKAAIEQHRTRTSVLNDKVNDILSTKGMINVMKKAQAQKRDMIKEIDERNARDNSAAQMQQRQDEAAKNLNKISMDAKERKLREEIKEVEDKLFTNTKKLAEEESKLAARKRATSLVQQLRGDDTITGIKRMIQALSMDIAMYKDRLRRLQADLDALMGAKNTAAATGEVVEVPPPVPDGDHEPPTSSGGIEPDKAGPGDPVDMSITPEEEAYRKALEALPYSINMVIQDYEQRLKAGQPWAWDPVMQHPDVKPEIDKDGALRTKVVEAMGTLKLYITSLPTPEVHTPSEETAPVIEEEPVEDVVTEEPVIEELPPTDLNDTLTPEDPADSPVTSEATTEAAIIVHKGKKSESGLTIMNSTLEYIDYQDTWGNYRIVSPEGKLNPDTPESILKPNGVKAGDVVTLRVTEYSGPVNSNTSMNTFKDQKFSDFFDADGKMLQTDYAIGNVPIGIYNESGVLLGYLPTQSRLGAQYEGATDLRNITDEAYAEESKRNMETRRRILQAGTPVTMQIKEKGPGTVIENYNKVSDKEYKRTRRPAKKMLPDTRIRFGNVSGGTVYENKKDATTKSLTSTPDDLRMIDGAPVVLLPMANGQYAVSPLSMPKLYDEENKDETALNTIMRALRVAVDPSYVADHQEILNRTGFDVATPQGLRAFINQYYTYTQSFDATQTLADPALHPGKRPKFMFNITDQGLVMLGTSFSGRKPMVLNKTNIEQFREALKAGLATRSKNVVYNDSELGVVGINDSSKFTEVYYTSTGWGSREHANYNEFIKSQASTWVNGTNKLSDGSYVYSANPQIELDESTLKVPVTYTASTVVPTAPPDSAIPSGREAELEALKPVRKEAVGNTDFSAALQIGIPVFYDQVYDALVAGTNIIAGQVDSNIARVKSFYDQGLIKNGSDVWLYLNKQKEALAINEKYKPVVPKTVVATVEDDDLDDSISFELDFMPSSSVSTIIEPSTELTPISLEVLNELYTFTKPGERNGLTPEQVLDTMIKNGIPYIAEGHNPFIKCN